MFAMLVFEEGGADVPGAGEMSYIRQYLVTDALRRRRDGGRR